MINFPDDENHSLSDLLPDLCSESAIWKSPLCFSSQEYFSEVLHAVIDRQNKILKEEKIECLENRTLNTIKALYDYRQHYKEESFPNAILTVLQLHLTYMPLREHSIEKNLVDSLTWVGYGLGDNFLSLGDNQEQKFYPEIGHLYSKLVAPISPVAADWFGYFYYIWGELGCDYEMGCSQIDAAINANNRLLDVGDVFKWSNNIGYLACWLARYEHEEAKPLIKHIESAYKTPEISSHVSLELLRILSTQAGRFSSNPPHVWAKLALDHYADQMTSHQRFIFSATAISPDADKNFEKTFPQLLTSLKETVSELVSTVEASVHRENRLSILSGNITPLLGNLIKLNQAKAAHEVLATWYSIDGGMSEDTAIILGNDPNSILACNKYKTFISKPNGLCVEHELLIKCMNEFLGISCSITGKGDFELNHPDSDRFGIPSEEKSNDYYNAINAHYKLLELGGFLNSENIKKIILIPAEHHPFQYSLKKSIGSCWPINVSLSTSYPDREIKHICLVSAGNSITEEIEIEIVTGFFEKSFSCVEITLLAFSDSSKQDFIDVYGSDNFDIIWLMSHGNFNHWEPESVCIDIFGEKMYLEELANIKINSCDTKRRLLFLNVCDGATSKSTGSISRIGFAPALSSANQCTISHLWPTNPWAASCFGAWLAIHLCNEGLFFNAYEKSIESMSLGKEGLIKSLIDKGVSADNALERIQRCNLDLSLMAHAGSAVFYD